MLRKCKPIPVSKYPTKEKIVDRTNCLAFALGIKRAKRRNGEFNLDKTHEPIETIFLKKAEKLGFNPKQFTQISRAEEAKTQGYIIRVYGFARDENPSNGTVSYDFHLIRRELDGQWVHKPGFFHKARYVTEEDWGIIYQQFGLQFVSFALDA